MSEPRLIPIPRFTDNRGALSVVEWDRQLPFQPKRFYWIEHGDTSAVRGSHCHWEEEEVILALRGSFTVLADDGRTRVEFLMNQPDAGLYIPAGVWHELYNFSDGALCAVFASGTYKPGDDCRDYQEFLAACLPDSQ